MEIETKGWTKDDHLVLAVSTGVDSMVLLHLLQTTLKSTYRKLTILHVNHNIRQASKEEEVFLKQYCDAHHLQLMVHHLDLSELTHQGKSIQHEARKQRYAWFASVIKTLGADVLLTAHHLDDQQETIFYRLMTGRSTRSRLGMSEIEERADYRIVRPLLNVDKATIRNYQNEHQVPFFEDASNQDNHYVRNDIRNRIFPMINENHNLDTNQLLKLKQWHDIQFERNQNTAQQFIARYATTNQTDVTIERQAFNELDDDIKVLVLDLVLAKFTQTQPISEHAYQEWFLQMKHSVAQVMIYATDKWNIQIVYDKFIIMGNTDTNLTTQRINQSGHYVFGTYQIVINDKIKDTDFPFLIRTRQPGDRFMLPDQKGHQKVNRLMINRKVPSFERTRLPIVLNKQGEIVAVGTLYTAPGYEESIEIINLGV